MTLSHDFRMSRHALNCSSLKEDAIFPLKVTKALYIVSSVTKSDSGLMADFYWHALDAYKTDLGGWPDGSPCGQLLGLGRC